MQKNNIRPKAWTHRPPRSRGPSEGLGATGGPGARGPKSSQGPRAPKGPRAPWVDGPRPWAHHSRGPRVLWGSGDTAVCPGPPGPEPIAPRGPGPSGVWGGLEILGLPGPQGALNFQKRKLIPTKFKLQKIKNLKFWGKSHEK